MDMAEHGTLRRGQDVNTSKLTEDQVRLIRRISKDIRQVDIAKMFNVSPTAILAIQKRRAWAWLT